MRRMLMLSVLVCASGFGSGYQTEIGGHTVLVERMDSEHAVLKVDGAPVLKLNKAQARKFSNTLRIGVSDLKSPGSKELKAIIDGIRDDYKAKQEE